MYWGMEQPQLKSQYLFGGWSFSFRPANGQVFAARPRPAESGLSDFYELKFANMPDGRINTYLLPFGQDAQGEMYILSSESYGPSGETGKVL